MGWGGAFPLLGEAWVGLGDGGSQARAAAAGVTEWFVFLALYTYTLITKHGYHVGPVPCVLHVHAHTHTSISPVACSLSSCCVILWFEVIYIHSCVVCDCCYLCFFVCLCVCLFFCFSLLVCFQVLLVAQRLDSPQTWIVFCFVFTGVAAGCLVFLSIFVLFLLLFSSSFPVPRSGSAL